MRRSGGILVVALCMLAAPAWGQGKAPSSTQFGVKGIVLAGGQAYVEEADAYFDIDLSLGVGGSVDTRLGDKILGGAFIDGLNIRAYDESAMMIDGGIALKAALGGGGNRPTWRPGIGFGYGTLSGVAGLESSHYFTVRAGVEAVLPSGWMAEAMAWASPSGGNADLTITFGPMLQLRVGHVF